MVGPPWPLSGLINGVLSQMSRSTSHPLTIVSVGAHGYFGERTGKNTNVGVEGVSQRELGFSELGIPLGLSSDH